MKEGRVSRQGARAHRVRGSVVVGVLLWVAAVASGFALLAAYEAVPGASGPAPRDWPAGSALEPDGTRPALVVFLHPRCPCSRATADSLERLAARFPGRFAGLAVFYRPAGTPEDWAQTSLQARFARIPGFRCVHDEGGSEAARFGARTSGHVLAFDAQGRRLFAGGVTGARGHAGSNAHGDALAAALASGAADAQEHPVFGCRLGSTACAREEACPR